MTRDRYGNNVAGRPPRRRNRKSRRGEYAPQEISHKKDYYGNSHCLDGPAIKYDDGEQAWYYHGMRHRLDGPAVIKSDAAEVEYWIFNKKYPEVDYYLNIFLNGCKDEK